MPSRLLSDFSGFHQNLYRISTGFVKSDGSKSVGLMHERFFIKGDYEDTVLLRILREDLKEKDIDSNSARK